MYSTTPLNSAELFASKLATELKAQSTLSIFREEGLAWEMLVPLRSSLRQASTQDPSFSLNP